MADAFAQEGKTLLAWEIGQPHGSPHCTRSNTLTAEQLNAIAKRYRLARRYVRSPRWFKPFQIWAQQSLNVSIEWKKIVRNARRVLALSRHFEQLFAVANARWLLIDCWYSLNSMPATIAARRCGMRICDVQHGMQENNHFAYWGWRKDAVKQFAAVPDAFWVWGPLDPRRAADFIGDTIVVGGHPWLNSWRSGADEAMNRETERARQLVAGFERSWLVTMQPSAQQPERIWQAIEASPRGWKWLIRTHPKMTGQDTAALRGRLADRLGKTVDMDAASQLPLHALLQVVTGHVTASSTCALEALAFGKPTVLSEIAGVLAYREHVRAGVMIDGTQGDLEEALATAEQASKSACLSVSDKMFASPDATRHAVRYLFDDRPHGGNRN